MKIRVGYELIYDFPQSTPMIMVLGTHFTRASDVIVPDYLTTSPSVPISPYRDVFGNWCSRIVAPEGRMRLSADGVVRDTGLPDVIAPSASQHPVEDLPAETLIFLLGSRYCETERLSEVAWNLFEKSPSGWARVQAICDFVHRHIAFGYEHARATMTSWEVFNEGKGVCRDYAHLAITFCRCMKFRRAIAPAISGTSACHRPMAQWISPAGSRPILAGGGTPLMRAITCRESAAC